jgi:hypothetical protein
MAKSDIETLRDEIARLKATLAGYGIQEERRPAERQTDFIEFGSTGHAALLGIELVESEEKAGGRTTYKSPATGRLFCLIDEITPFIRFADPRQAALLTLRGKVSTLESGRPEPPPNSPSLWVPREIPM